MAKKKAHFPDNWPSNINPNRGREITEPTDLNDTGVETLLRGCRSAYELVGAIAAMEAIRTAAEHDVGPPNWALDAVENALGGKSKANKLRRLDAQIRELKRWEKVTICELNSDEKIEKCIKEAAKLLGKEKDPVDPETIHKSYYKIQKRLRNYDEQRIVLWILGRIQERRENKNSGQ